MSLIYSNQQNPLLHPGYFEAINILGLTNPGVERVVHQIIQSEHWNNADSDLFESYATSIATPKSTVQLRNNANGMARVSPSAINLSSPATYVALKLSRSGSVMRIEGADIAWMVDCWDSGIGLHIEWPEALKINGDLVTPLPSNPTLYIPVEYPLQAVLERIDANPTVYDFLEKHGLEDVYYVADRPEEKLAIVAKALHKEVGDE